MEGTGTVTTATEQLLRPGGVGIIPTDTVYGLVARAADQMAVDRLYGLKGRVSKPGTIVAANITQLERLGLKHRYLKAVDQYWPGALSIVIPCDNPSLAYLHMDVKSLAVRVPNDSKLLELLHRTGPLLTSSANTPGAKPAATVDQARQYFGDKVDFYENGGNLADRRPSTVIRIIDDAIDVLRPGAVKVSEGKIRT